MKDPVARYLLGTDAFVSCCLYPKSDPYRWVWEGGNINARGIVISTATVQQVHREIRATMARPGEQQRAAELRGGFENALRIFRDKRCILPIREDITSFVESRLGYDIVYVRPVGPPQRVGTLEKIVLATALCGVNNRGLWLVDYHQPYAFPSLQDVFGLSYETFQTSRALAIR